MKELFSQRYRDESGDPEVYIYNNFPEKFRNQCFHIIYGNTAQLGNKGSNTCRCLEYGMTMLFLLSQ